MIRSLTIDSDGLSGTVPEFVVPGSPFRILAKKEPEVKRRAPPPSPRRKFLRFI